MAPALLVLGLLLGLYTLLYYNCIKGVKCRAHTSLRGKTVIITGGNTGIGKMTALALAQRRARVILACRDRARGESAVYDIRRESGNSQVLFMHLDLASLDSVRAFAETFLRSEPRLDVLINNAGVGADGRKGGSSLVFQVNHLGHFLLTHLLLERLTRSAPSRVVIVASSAHRAGRIDLEKLREPVEGFLQNFQAYCTSKLANVLYARELANRLEGTHVTCYAVHPGIVNTELFRYLPGWLRPLFVPISWLFFRDPADGAQTSLYCASQEGIEMFSGRYFVDCQVKIMTERELLAVACEQFLGKNVQDVKNVVLQTLEGHLRSILGTLTVEQIYQDRDQFAKLVREVAAPDVGRMGIEILSFTIKDVYDKVEYLSSLGKTQTAVVQRDADIGVAEAERDAGIREAECKREMLDVKFMSDTKTADSKRAFEMQKAAFSQEINIKTAEAQLAYELQGAREQQKIRQEEMEIEVVQRKKQIDVEEKEIIRMDKELIATVKRPAEAEAHRMQQIAEGEKVQQVLIARAEAEKIRKIGEAEASVIQAIGKAEAEKMKLKAEAYQQYGDAAKLALVLDALPQIAARVAAPLAKVDEIVILSGEGSKVTSELNRLLAEIPASVHALTGVDLAKIPLIQKATGAQA